MTKPQRSPKGRAGSSRVAVKASRSSQLLMFKLHLDLVIVYTPPMSDHGQGIRLTREIELPFPPYDGLHICGRQIDAVYGPEGFVLKEVKWDLDRKVFLGQTTLSSLDLPMEDIPADLRSWLDVGWRFGSYADHYESHEAEDAEEDVKEPDPIHNDNVFESAIVAPTLPPRKRSKQLNDVMRAMIRVMVEAGNNESVAYAMDKTKRYFTEHQLEKNQSKEAQQWRDAQREYVEMGWDKQGEWRERILRRHARLEKLASHHEP